MREETANVILPAEEALLVRHLEARRQNGVRMNVNFLGEALLGEAEARRRLDSYALLSAAEAGALDRVQFEMLKGMVNAQRRALLELTQNLLLYAPATKKEDFINAVGYLFRRLDENTGPDNFLRHAFGLVPDSPEWKRLEEGFLESSRCREDVSETPRRARNRLAESGESARPSSWNQFVNEPDTNFSLPVNRVWAQGIIERWKPRHSDNKVEVPLVVAGRKIFRNRETRDCLDPSRPGLIVGRYRQANEEDVERAVACARNDADGWRRKPVEERSRILAAVARELHRGRGDLMGAALADGGKTLPESDPEVSEVVDFVVFYDLAARYFHHLPGLQVRSKGVVVVVSPWNFPIAIPGGGIAAALAAGNTVILKPSPDTVLVGHELCQCFRRAGISRRTLQMAPCAVATGGSRLVSHPEVDAVILTGGTETALRMLRLKPKLNLLAETGGKNATTLTALGDRELAISHVIHSAFSHRGQKCSATSLLLVEEEVYQDPKFKETLCDAVRSLEVGSAWDLRNRMGPLIRPPSGALERGLQGLEPGEAWAVMPRRMGENPCLYSPGVKWDVQPGSFTHLTELFGPVLGVMRVKNLDQALSLIRGTGYGLTAGLESLDDREQAYWCHRVEAGNLYVNRGTTGAIVLRQPFEGMAKSAFGPGIKAGGPNYVAQLMDFSDGASPTGPFQVADPHLAALRSRLKQPSPAAVSADRDDLPRVVAALESYGAGDRVPGGGRFRSVPGASSGPGPGPGGVALVSEGAERQYRLPPLRQPGHPGRGREGGGLVARNLPAPQTVRTTVDAEP